VVAIDPRRAVTDTRDGMAEQVRIARAEGLEGSKRQTGSLRAPPAGVLALQRRAGNRAVGQVIARRVEGTDPAIRTVKLEVGVELTEKLARTAWALTAKGPLDDSGVEVLRQVALEHYWGTIDDDERLFIAALLDKGNSAMLHAAYPKGFSERGSVIVFSAASITETNRRIVRDSGRSKRIEPTESEKTWFKDPLDQEIVAMTGPFHIVAMHTLKMAHKARIDHLKLYFAMLNGASDSTPGDRAYAGAAYVIALSQGLTGIAGEIMAQNLKVDEVSQTWFQAQKEGTHAMFVPESSGVLKGDTIYVPDTLDLENLAHVGTLLHELQHASDAAGAKDNPRDFSRVELEEAAYERQSRFYMVELEKLAGDARETQEKNIAERIGPTHIYLMVLAALESSAGDGQWEERSQIVREVNAFVRAVDSDAALESRELERALNDTKDGNREKARAGIRADNRRFKRSATVHLGGLKGESRLDRTPHDRTPTGRMLARDDTEHDRDEMATRGKRVEEAEVARGDRRRGAHPGLRAQVQGGKWHLRRADERLRADLRP
jgi:hypothetical protein